MVACGAASWEMVPVRSPREFRLIFEALREKMGHRPRHKPKPSECPRRLTNFAQNLNQFITKDILLQMCVVWYDIQQLDWTTNTGHGTLLTLCQLEPTLDGLYQGYCEDATQRIRPASSGRPTEHIKVVSCGSIPILNQSQVEKMKPVFQLGKEKLEMRLWLQQL